MVDSTIPALGEGIGLGWVIFLVLIIIIIFLIKYKLSRRKPKLDENEEVVDLSKVPEEDNTLTH